MRKLLFVIAVVVIGAINVNATVWNPTNEFSITNGNPNGVWSYGYMLFSGSDDGVVFSDFTLLPYCTTTYYGRFWGMDGGDIPSIWSNDTTDTAENVAPGQLALHPGWGSQAVVLRWTAPDSIADTISIVGEFFAGNDGQMLVGVLVNGELVWSGTDCGTFDLSKSISTGDTVDFVVYADDISSGATPIEVNITEIPEPATIALLCLGVLSFVRRKQ